MTLEQIGAAAKKAAAAMNRLTVVQKNEGLSLAAEELVRCADEILQANAMDLEQARQAGMKESLLDRLTLTRERIQAMAEGLRQVADGSGWGNHFYESIAKRTPGGAEESTARRDWNYLRVPPKCDGRCLCALF